MTRCSIRSSSTSWFSVRVLATLRGATDQGDACTGHHIFYERVSLHAELPKVVRRELDQIDVSAKVAANCPDPPTELVARWRPDYQEVDVASGSVGPGGVRAVNERLIDAREIGQCLLESGFDPQGSLNDPSHLPPNL